MAVTIQPAVLRDASYVMAHMNDDDRGEVLCQVPDGVRTYELAYWLLMKGTSFVAVWKDLPVMFFGVDPINITCLSVWAIGTKHSWRAAPAIVDFFINELTPMKQKEGYLTMEARSIVTHTAAHKWMTDAGAVRSGEPFPFGKGGELFQLFRWTVTDYHTILTNHRRQQ